MPNERNFDYILSADRSAAVAAADVCKKVRRTWIYAAWVLVALRLLIPIQNGEMNFSVLTAAKPLTETVTQMEDLRVIGKNEREAEIQVTKDYIEQDQTVFTPEVQEYIRQEQEANTPAEEIVMRIRELTELGNWSAKALIPLMGGK